MILFIGSGRQLDSSSGTIEDIPAGVEHEMVVCCGLVDSDKVRSVGVLLCYLMLHLPVLAFLDVGQTCECCAIAQHCSTRPEPVVHTWTGANIYKQSTAVGKQNMLFRRKTPVAYLIPNYKSPMHIAFNAASAKCCFRRNHGLFGSGEAEETNSLRQLAYVCRLCGIYSLLQFRRATSADRPGMFVELCARLIDHADKRAL